jgi:hypothetical protein
MTVWKKELSEDGTWLLQASPVHGDIEHEIDAVIAALRAHLQQ